MLGNSGLFDRLPLRIRLAVMHAERDSSGEKFSRDPPVRSGSSCLGAAMRKWKTSTRVGCALGGVGVGLLVAIWCASARMEQLSAGRVITTVDALPHQRVGLVLGCAPTIPSGASNLYFRYRMEAAAQAYHARKIDYLLVSGDHHNASYDEPTAMQQALLRLNVPADRIIRDGAGYSTLDSIVRARQVYGLNEVCVVTQRDHALRALYLAQAHGLDAVAFAAREVPVTGGGLRTRLREALARVGTLFDIHLVGRQPRTLGPLIKIEAATTPPPVR